MATGRLNMTGRVLSAAGLAMLVGFSLAAPPDEVPDKFSSALLGSAHDFSHGDRQPRDLCLPCHAPHLPGSSETGPALRGPRAVRAGDVVLDGGSLLCLSCHDGIVATDVFTSSHATRLASQLGASQLGYGGLQGHPVGVKYPIGEPKYQPLSAVISGGVIKTPDDRIQCTTCHDPHNAARQERMLVKSNERSRLCLSCHRL